MGRYQDIIGLSRPESKHPKMSLDNRAKIFAPFSALRGFEIEILAKEKDRVLQPKSALTDQMENELDWNLRQLRMGDAVHVTWFKRLKTLGDRELGEYLTGTATFVGLDMCTHTLLLSGLRISIADICGIEGVDREDEWSEPVPWQA